jgi:hypothetical protein
VTEPAPEETLAGEIDPNPAPAESTEADFTGAPQTLHTLSPSFIRLPHVLQNILFLQHSFILRSPGNNRSRRTKTDIRRANAKLTTFQSNKTQTV